MSVKIKSATLNTLITAVSATARQVVYTASNGVAKVVQCTVNNKHASSAYYVYVFIKSDATTSGALTEVQRVQVPAAESKQFDLSVGHTIPSGGTLQAYSEDATNTYITLSVIERQQ